jgi:hypothetical protein
MDYLYLKKHIEIRNVKWKIIMFEIWGSQHGVDVDGGLLCYSTVCVCGLVGGYQHTFKLLVTTYKTHRITTQKWFKFLYDAVIQSWCSSVREVSDCRLDDCGSIPSRGKGFFL